MHKARSFLIYRPLFVTLLSLFSLAACGKSRIEGTATIKVGGDEHIIPIECVDAKRPMLGVSTEPARITKERTGRISSVHLTIRPWQDTEDMIITLDKYVAWRESPPGAGGVLNILMLDMSPIARSVNGVPTQTTSDDYSKWKYKKIPAGLEDVSIRADCRSRNPDAPSFRKG